MEAFKNFYGVDVTPHTEKKNGMTYLSWAWAWAELKKVYPMAQRKVYENEIGRPYFDDGKTAWVKVGIIVDGLEHIDYLPVMDYKNKSIPVEFITSFEVNKAIQRSTVKAIALHGLGLYIYAGEDMPELPTMSKEQIEEFQELFAPAILSTALQIMKCNSIATVKSQDIVTFKQFCIDAENNAKLNHLRGEIVKQLTMLNSPMEAKNSVKKHLAVDSLKDCFDADMLSEFLKHTIEKVNKNKEEKDASN